MDEIDETHNPFLMSWVESANDPASDFPIQNLPLGIFSVSQGVTPSFGIAIGDKILDVAAARKHGLLVEWAADLAQLGSKGDLNVLLSQGRESLRELRRQVSALLNASSDIGKRAASLAPRILRDASECWLHLPTTIGNYTDFFAGIHHARVTRQIIAPGSDLFENYRWVPVAYHGRASSVRPSGTAVRRPQGQRASSPGQPPIFAATAKLDFELEMAIYVGKGNPLGEPISISSARSHLAGLGLLNDWSARDIQHWEIHPLGPFLAKNFMTTVSPWIVTLDALAPFRIPVMRRPDGDPAPLDYLYNSEDQESGGIDVSLVARLSTAKMRARGIAAVEIARSNAKYLYWTPSQMISHHTCGGCNLMPGDVLGTGTISGPTPAQYGSLMELTAGFVKPVALPDGEMRTSLESGDEVSLTGRCTRDGFASIGFGHCTGRVEG
jgi:fumarylacetoacetase